jgi:hypothetical protein
LQTKYNVSMMVFHARNGFRATPTYNVPNKSVDQVTNVYNIPSNSDRQPDMLLRILHYDVRYQNLILPAVIMVVAILCSLLAHPINNNHFNKVLNEFNNQILTYEDNLSDNLSKFAISLYSLYINVQKCTKTIFGLSIMQTEWINNLTELSGPWQGCCKIIVQFFMVLLLELTGCTIPWMCMVIMSTWLMYSEWRCVSALNELHKVPTRKTLENMIHAEKQNTFNRLARHNIIVFIVFMVAVLLTLRIAIKTINKILYKLNITNSAFWQEIAIVSLATTYCIVIVYCIKYIVAPESVVAPVSGTTDASGIANVFGGFLQQGMLIILSAFFRTLNDVVPTNSIAKLDTLQNIPDEQLTLGNIKTNKTMTCVLNVSEDWE